MPCRAKGAALGFLAALAATGAAAQGPPPLEAYSRSPALDSPVLSTDGATLAYLATEVDRRFVEILPAGGGAVRRLALGQTVPLDLDWISPDHLLISVSTTLEGSPGLVPRQKVRQAISYNAKTNSYAPLLQNTPDVLATVQGFLDRGRHRGAPSVLIAGFNPSDFGASLYRADPNTGRGVKLEDGSLDSVDWLPRPDGTLVAKAERAKRGPWVLKVRRGGGWTDLVSLPAGPEYPHLLGFGRDGASALVSPSRNGERGVFELSLETGTWGPSLSPPGTPVGRSFVDDAGDGRLLAIALEGPRPDLLAFDPVLRRAWTSVVKSFPGKRVELVDLADDRRKLVIRTSGVDDPGAYYLFDEAAKRADLIGETYPGLTPAQVAPAREITFKAGDGALVHGVLTIPPGREAKGLPLVLLHPNWFSTRQDLRFDWMAQAIASRGYAVMSLTARGSDPTTAARSLPKLLDDAADAVRFLGRDGMIDPDRACAVGETMGGWAAVAGVTVQPVFRCAVSINGLLDPRRELSRLHDSEQGWMVAGAVAFTQALGVSGLNDPNLNALSPAHRAGGGRAPVLLIHAAKSDQRPPAHSQAVHAALKKANRPVEYVELPGDDTSLVRSETRQRALAETVRFLLANNPPR